MPTPAKTKVRTLAECEAVIERGLRSFMEAGAALGYIRSNGLYLSTHETFDDYCEERWGFTRQRATHLTEAAEVANLVVTNVTTRSPLTEFVARPLVSLRSNPDLLRQTWAAIGDVREKPTAELVAAVVSRAKVAIAAADRDLSEFLATIVEQEIEKIEAEKERKAAAKESRAPALVPAPKPDYFVLFDILFALNGFAPPAELFASIPPDCWGRLDGIESASDYLNEIRAMGKARREAANRRLVAG